MLENLIAYFGNLLEKTTGVYLIGNGEKLSGGAHHRHHRADAQAQRPVRPGHREAGVEPMATTTTANGLAAVRRMPRSARGCWLWPLVVVLALLPIIGGKTGLISNYGFLQLEPDDRLRHRRARPHPARPASTARSRSAMAPSSPSAPTRPRS